MKILIQFIFLLLSTTSSNPLVEFDKSFLFENKKNLTQEKFSPETVSCIDYFINLEQQNKKQDDTFFNNLNVEQINSCCVCMNTIFTDDKFKNDLKSEKNDSSVEFLNKLFNDWKITACINEAIGSNNDRSLSEKELLSYFVNYFQSHDSADKDTSPKKPQVKPSKNVKPVKTEKDTKLDKNSFEYKIKDYVKIEGLFNFYYLEEKNSLLMELKPNQLEEIYLANYTRQSGDANWFDGSSMMGEFPMMFKKVGEKIQAIEVNVKFRSKKNLAITKALENHISNSIISSTKIISKPSMKEGSYLIDASNFFIADIGGISQMKGVGFKFDKSNSYYNYIKSFPNNSEIDVSIHYKSISPKYKFTLADSRSMIHKYHISISSLPTTSYEPRIADDRVGHFMTMYQDYSDTYTESPYVRYINRWNLQKLNPSSNMSEPIEPIVFWIENTVPHEFRDAVKEGIEKWNLAFEKIGYKNAIIAKQMPDDASWDPADTRYNTIRWMVQPGSAYAVGPSRANPFTGELYDADIRIGSDFVRFYYNDFIEFIDPIQLMAYEDSIASNHSHDDCHYQDLMKHKMSYAWNYLTATNQIKNSNKEMKQFVHEGIVDLILHEVGHTLGLRHNFKASSVYSIEELSNPDFTKKYGITGSVMDYNATNLLDGGVTHFQTVPGPYDYWAIEYAYSEQKPFSRKTEEDFLSDITSKSTQPLLAYGTDEDAGSRGIDPYINRRDLTADPIKHYIKRIDIGNEFIDNLLENFEKDGDRYPKIRSVFFQGFYEYYGGARNIAKFIGGIKHSRHHIGQEYKDYPLEIIDVSIQKEALDFYLNYIFDKDAFQYKADLLNKMAPERLGDFEGTIYQMSRLDFPIHSIVKNIQNTSLFNLFNYRVHNRIIDNKAKLNQGEAFELDYLFSEITKSIWSEIKSIENINSFRRQLQMLHINYLIEASENKTGAFPNDSQSLSRMHLNQIYNNINEIIFEKSFDDYTLSHLMKVSDLVKKSLDLD